MLRNRKALLVVAAAVALFVPPSASAHHLFDWGPPTSMSVGAGAADVVTWDLNGDGHLDLASVATGDGSAGSGGVAVSFGDGAGTFTPFAQVLAGGAPVAIAVGDVNGDTFGDLAVANSAPGEVVVLVNNGAGSFTTSATLAVGAAPSDVALEAVDRGRVLDVVAVSEAGDSLTVWTGKNDGTFRLPIVTSVSNPVSVAVKDLSSDGSKDVAIASAADNLVRILLGNRTGAFAAGATYPASVPSSVYIALKMNRDSMPDLAYTEQGANLVTYRLGVGDGTFGDVTSFTVDSPARVVVEDVSYTFQDIIVTNQAGNTVDVMLGFGNGTFDPPTRWAVGTGPLGIAVGAFDSAFAPDMAIANTVSGDVTVMLNATPHSSEYEPQLLWKPPTSMSVGAGATDVVTSDLNGDGHLDLASVATGDGSAGSGGVAVSFGDGAGTFTPFAQVLAGGAPVAIAVGDVNGDTFGDLAVANSAPGEVVVLVNNGAGSFTTSATLAVGAAPSDVALEAVDRGRVLDVVAVSEAGDSLTVWTGKNDGTFRLPIVTSVSNPVSVAVKDLNGDLKKDVAIASAEDDLVRILLGDSLGGFAAGATYPASMPTSVYIATKMNKDNLPDLAYTERGANLVTYRLGVGDGTFAAATSFTVNSPARVVVLDVNHKSQDIIVTSESGNTVDVMLGLGDGTFDPPAHVAVGGTGPVGIAVGAFDSAFAPDMAIANTVSGDVTVMLSLTTPEPPGI